MPSQNKIRFSIRTKLFFLVLIAFTVLILATSWQIGEQANKVSLKAIERSLQQSSTVLNTTIDSRYTSIKETAFGIARDGRVLPLVYDGDSPTLQDLSSEFERVLDFDILFITSADGTILARSDRPEAVGRVMAGRSPLFDKALAGENSQGIFVSRGKLHQIVVVPIFDNVAGDVIRGSVALAYEFSSEMAQEINALTASEIGFFIFTRDSQRKINGAKSTYNTNESLGQALDQFFSENTEQWNRIYEAQGNTTDMRLAFGEDDFFSVTHPLFNEKGKPLGFVMALRSRTELLKPYMDIQRTVIIIGFACLVVASLFAWIFSLRISRPIIELVAVTKQIQDGNYPAIKNTSSKDEVGMLYSAVVRMGNALREKAELENYLAQMSDEINISESIPLAIKDDTFDDTQLDSTIITTSETPGDEDRTIVSISNPNGHIKENTDSQIDDIIDERYRIIRHIGAGAMGTVFLAHDIALDESVAIKIMPKTLFSQQESINFKEEIRLARQITHRNILRTFDFGEWKHFYYITMEYVQGYDLGTLLKNKGAFDTHIGVIMARQICSAMNAAHEQGIIHRDLKPSNMMINRQGILKIMDFGLAMKVGKNKEKNPQKTSNTIAGTPRYMAPEQFYNWPLDERTDIYAIGIILYAIFNGKPPFNEKDVEKLAKLHLKVNPPEIVGKNGKFPDALQNVIFKALAKKPENRYQSVRFILDQLNTISTSANY